MKLFQIHSLLPKHLIPLSLSVLSGLVVVAQVHLAHNKSGSDEEKRVLVANHRLPEGARLHPKDFSFRLLKVEESRGYVDDQMAHLLWGREVRSQLERGDELQIDQIAPMRIGTTVTRSSPPVVPIEIIREEGE